MINTLKNYIASATPNHKNYNYEKNFLLFSCLTLAVFFIAKLVFLKLAFNLLTSSIQLVLALIISCVFYKIKLIDTPPAYRILIRLMISTFTVYALTYYLAVIPNDLNMQTRSIYHLMQMDKIIVAICGAIALIRPSFAIFPVVYTYTLRSASSHIMGIPTFHIDYQPVLENTLFLIVAVIIYHQFKNMLERDRGDVDNKLHFLEGVILVAIGIHFGNYFWSGVEKLKLSGGITSWALHDQLKYLLISGKIRNTIPISHFPRIIAFIQSSLDKHYIAFNTMILAAQLGCIISIFRMSLIKATTFIYDLMHTVIFICTGLFFWKWIIMNLAIILSLNLFKQKKMCLFYIIIIFFSILGSTLLFTTAHLAWYDSRTMNLTKIYAITRNNHKFQIPTNYFLNESYNMGQSYISFRHNKFTNIGPWGVTKNFKTMQISNQCNLKTSNKSNLVHTDLVTLSVFLTHLQHYINHNTNSNGLFDYRWYPRHLWSSPTGFEKFYTLNKKSIIAFQITRELICMSNGTEPTKILKQTSNIIKVNKDA